MVLCPAVADAVDMSPVQQVPAPRTISPSAQRAGHVLRTLTEPAAAAGLRMNEVADGCGLTRSSVGSALVTLEARGAVRHRVGVWVLTAAGRQLANTVPERAYTAYRAAGF